MNIAERRGTTAVRLKHPSVATPPPARRRRPAAAAAAAAPIPNTQPRGQPPLANGHRPAPSRPSAAPRLQQQQSQQHQARQGQQPPQQPPRQQSLQQPQQQPRLQQQQQQQDEDAAAAAALQGLNGPHPHNQNAPPHSEQHGALYGDSAPNNGGHGYGGLQGAAHFVPPTEGSALHGNGAGGYDGGGCDGGGGGGYDAGYDGSGYDVDGGGYDGGGYGSGGGEGQDGSAPLTGVAAVGAGLLRELPSPNRTQDPEAAPTPPAGRAVPHQPRRRNGQRDKAPPQKSPLGLQRQG